MRFRTEPTRNRVPCGMNRALYPRKNFPSLLSSNTKKPGKTAVTKRREWIIREKRVSTWMCFLSLFSSQRWFFTKLHNNSQLSHRCFPLWYSAVLLIWQSELFLWKLLVLSVSVDVHACLHHSTEFLANFFLIKFPLVALLYLFELWILIFPRWVAKFYVLPSLW